MLLSRRGFLLLTTCVGCESALAGPEHAEARGGPSPPTPAASAVPVGKLRAPSKSTAQRTDGAPPALTAYPWHADATIQSLPAADTLERRFSPPDGFERAPLAATSFGHWLRALPLAAPGTGVRSYAGGLLLPDGHPHLAAVSTLDTGTADLQQCADAIMRLHAEWLWSTGRAAEASYVSGGGPIPWRRYVAGGTPTLSGNSFAWKGQRPRKHDHATYRRYLDVVFSWANTISLQNAAQKPARATLTAGDFFVLGGSPGHAVLVLDVAADAGGRRVALLGQSYMPAQSFQVLRPGPLSVWFELDDDRGVKTPFWPRFPWSSLRRLPG